MAKNTIKLKKYSDVIEEYIAASAITPGHLVNLASTGKVQVHNSSEGPVLPMFALEDELQGKEISEAYAADDPVQVWIPGRGDEVYALLKDGENVAVGDFVESAGDGTLQKYDENEDLDVSSSGILVHQHTIVGMVVEAVDLSSSSGTYPSTGFRVKVKII